MSNIFFLKTKELKNCTKKFAFTLAEVLIVTTIVGVVSALTLPILNNKIQFSILKLQTKKAYSVILQAEQFVKMQDEYLFGCYDGSSTRASGCPNYYWPELIKHIKVTKTCNSKAYKNKCVPNYKPENFPIYGSCPNFGAEYIRNSAKVYVLANGVIIIPYKYGWGSGNFFLFDVNGHAGPNKIGYDVFGFGHSLSSKGQVIVVENNCMQRIPAGGKTLNQMLK